MQELAKLEPARRGEILTEAGVAAGDQRDVERSLLALPHAHITKVEAFVDGEDDIKEHDLLTVQVRRRKDTAWTPCVRIGVAWLLLACCFPCVTKRVSSQCSYLQLNTSQQGMQGLAAYGAA